MTTARAFLQDLIANQDDDTPRLVYADWLEDQGNAPRAEFIRIQCTLAGVDEEEAGWADLVARKLRLWAEHGEGWLKELPSWVTRRKFCVFRRGFPAHLECTARQLVKHGASLWRATPIDSIRLRDASGLEGTLATLRHLTHLRKLDLSYSGLGGDEAATLIRSPFLANLTWLNLRGQVSQALAETLASAPLHRLRWLDLYGADTRFGPTGARLLASAPALGALETLNLGICRVGVEGAAALIASPHLAGLKDLNLDGSDLGDEGAVMLAKWPGLARLTTLHLPQNQIGDRGVAALASSPWLTGLRVLTLWNNPITQAGALALAASKSLTNLTSLTLWNTYRWQTQDHQLDPGGEAALRAAFGERVHIG